MFCSVGIVGEMEDEEGTASYYIWTHKKFDIGFNGKQIVDVNLTSENKVKLKLDAKIPFTYEVNWKKSNVKFEDRFDKYLDPNFFQHRVSAFLTFLYILSLFFFFFMEHLNSNLENFYIKIYNMQSQTIGGGTNEQYNHEHRRCKARLHCRRKHPMGC
jgi:ATP-dependent Zn protease